MLGSGLGLVVRVGVGVGSLVSGGRLRGWRPSLTVFLYSRGRRQPGCEVRVRVSSIGYRICGHSEPFRTLRTTQGIDLRWKTVFVSSVRVRVVSAHPFVRAVHTSIRLLVRLVRTLRPYIPPAHFCTFVLSVRSSHALFARSLHSHIRCFEINEINRLGSIH